MSFYSLDCYVSKADTIIDSILMTILDCWNSQAGNFFIVPSCLCAIKLDEIQ